ncbi:adenine-specific methyltransferase EcoRI family protein [Streptococcus suis]|uniref:adenine-specific methyltransferase EcoRI family protein n=1 Tax=Streptococcus suis TaxID=1307 RepID=UPI001582401C|nr:adenine-specific methyltransferase EcoRI family protein [Streptococcus suis]
MATSLHNAKLQKKDEFYTRYSDIENEMNAFLEFNPKVFQNKTVLLPCDDPEWSNFTRYFAQNFESLGLKKLISTSFANDRKTIKFGQLSLFETESPHFDKDKTNSRGKIFTLSKDGKSKVDISNLKWQYLEGDGDFNSDEVIKLRDEADVIVTNPPFSLFREFIKWIMDGKKEFAIIGHQNAITYKDVFSYIKDNKIWLGKPFKGNVGFFMSPYEDLATSSQRKKDLIRVSGVMWFTNIEHGRRHQPLQLMTEADNLKFNTKLIKKLREFDTQNYPKYYNYDAIEVPFTMAIPSDFDGYMGVPITFLDKFNPEQFEIIGLGISSSGIEIGVRGYTDEHRKYRKGIQKRGTADGDLYFLDKNGFPVVPYARIIIKRKGV